MAARSEPKLQSQAGFTCEWLHVEGSSSESDKTMISSLRLREVRVMRRARGRCLKKAVGGDAVAVRL